jgi:hypothetical protein
MPGFQRRAGLGGTVEGATYFLCRAGTIDDVRQKAKELGLIGHSSGGV